MSIELILVKIFILYYNDYIKLRLYWINISHYEKTDSFSAGAQENYMTDELENLDFADIEEILFAANYTDIFNFKTQMLNEYDEMFAGHVDIEVWSHIKIWSYNMGFSKL